MPILRCDVIAHTEISGRTIIEKKPRLVLVRVPDLKPSGRKGSGIHDLLIMDPIDPLWNKIIHYQQRMIPGLSRYGMSEDLAGFVSDRIQNIEVYDRFVDVIRGTRINPIHPIYETPLNKLAKLTREFSLVDHFLHPEEYGSSVFW
jgi:hypothetical protein